MRQIVAYAYACTQKGKEAAYKGLVRPILECSGSVWEPSGIEVQNGNLESAITK